MNIDDKQIYKFSVVLFQPYILCHALYKEHAALKEAPTLTMTSLGYVLCKLAFSEYSLSSVLVKSLSGRKGQERNKGRHREKEKKRERVWDSEGR
jgi:hypothetical protein